MIRVLHMARRRTQIDPQGILAAEIRKIADLEIVDQTSQMQEEKVAELMRGADVLITNHASTPIPASVAGNPGRLKYVLNLGGTCRATVPIEIIRAGIKVTNWGDTPAQSVAEGAAALLLAVLKDLRGRVDGLKEGRGGTARALGLRSGTLNGTKLGLYGCGVIGGRFVEMMRPFRPQMTVFDPYARSIPDGCRRVGSLEELFDDAEAIVVWAGLSDETRGSVTAGLLAKLPDGGIVINAARGEIIDQEALFSELRRGRLRAGLDVLASDNYFSQGHEAHAWPNLLLTCHDVNSAHWPERPEALGYAGEIVIDNLKRFVAGEPLRFEMDETRYLRSS